MSVNFMFDAIVLVSNVLLICMLAAFAQSPPSWAAAALIAALLVPLIAKISADLARREMREIHTYCGLFGTFLMWVPLLLLHVINMPESGIVPHLISMSAYLGVTLLVAWVVLPWLRHGQSGR